MATKPSLALIPSGYRANKLYSVLPSNGDGDFDFSRGSTATRINKDGLIETVDSNVPRLNYPLIDGVVSGCPSLLLEPQSLNKITHSENIADGSWAKTNVTVNSDLAISPDGTQNADKVNYSISANQGVLQKLSLSSVNSVSFFIKYIDLEYILLFVGGSSRGNYINIKEGYVEDKNLGGGLNVSIKKYPNDWLRIEASDGNNGSNLSIYASDNTLNYAPITVNGSFYLWGCQAEANSYVTSYVPTTSSTATRSAETCNNAGDVNTFNDSEGVLMAEISALADDGGKWISLSNGSTSQRISFANENGNIRVYIFNGVVIWDYIYYNINTITSNKISLKYKSGDYSLFINGFKINSSTSSLIASGINSLQFNSGGGSGNFFGNTKQVQYYDTDLTDSDLETLTSWVSFEDMANGQQYSIK